MRMDLAATVWFGEGKVMFVQTDAKTRDDKNNCNDFIERQALIENRDRTGQSEYRQA